MSSSEWTVNVPTRWVLGCPELHPAKDSQQGFEDWRTDVPGAIVYRYPLCGCLEIAACLNEDGRAVFYVALGQQETVANSLAEAERWLVAELVREGAKVEGIAL